MSIRGAAHIAGAYEHPERKITDRSPAQIHAEVIAYGTGTPANDADRPIYELVARWAARTPDAIAVRAAGTELSYLTLERRAAWLAGHLREMGVRPGVNVAVLMHRSADLIVTLLAIVKAGGAYAALNPEDPWSRQGRLAGEIAAPLLLADAAHADVRLPGVRTVAVTATEQEASSAPGRAAGPNDAAYVSFTSGSTGEPKAVLVPHRAVARLIRDPSWAEFGPGDVFCQFAPVAFDASTLEIWGPLANGGRVVVMPPGPVDVADLAGRIRAEGITVLWLTAGLFHALAGTHLEAFAGLRLLISGGDVVSAARVRAVLAAHPHITFINGYGPTENTTFTACWTTRDKDVPASVPIGRPVNGTRVYVLDRDLRPVPVGVRGELYAAGLGLAHGYLNSSAETAVRFVADPLAHGAGERMYRTGDLARWLPDGTLEFLGRADAQVKIQGFRVEPAAVEARLAACPEVREAAAVVQADKAGSKRLLGYVTLHDSEAGHPGAAGARIRASLAQDLPPYMVPWAVLVRRELPLNRNGKVDRAALPSSSRAPRNVWNDFVAPATYLEITLADMWGDLLGIEPVGTSDDFFDLGGHSLLAATLIEDIQRRFEVELSARTLYREPTVAELAVNLARLRPGLSHVTECERVSR